jgi:predicted Zn-dependent protease with MMP-like domain
VPPAGPDPDRGLAVGSPADAADDLPGDAAAAADPEEPADDPASDPEEPARLAFEEMVEAAIAALPPEFAAQLPTVAILVEDDPPPGRSLFGLYEGVPRTRLGADGAAWPSRITLYRRPHELHFPDPRARAEAVRGTLLHEVGHHLGIDEARMREIEAARRRHERFAG